MNLYGTIKRIFHYNPLAVARRCFDSILTLAQVIREYTLKNTNNFNDYNLGNNVKLYYWKLSNHEENLGDYLSKVVVTHFLRESSSYTENPESRTLFAIGSILGFRCQDAVIWGSGLLSPSKLFLYRLALSSLDIRAVRGPKTREVLLKLGKKCPEVYGDPAILMPQLYLPKITQKIYDVSLILHFSKNLSSTSELEQINRINIVTTDYKNVIDQIVQSKKVISSSLHGIILAEAYGVPAILLLEAGMSTFKYEDWYYSTGRNAIVIAYSLEEALRMKPMNLPDLHVMQEQLFRAFPADLWYSRDLG